MSGKTNHNAGNQNKHQDEQKETSLKAEILSWVEVIVIAVVLALFIDNFIIINATVPSGSMEQTIMTGSRVLGTRFSYWFKDPQRGDIVVFKYPIDEAKGKNTKYIKRIIGLPGETVTIVNGVVYVQGKDGKSEQLRDDFITACTPTGNFGPYVVPKDSYFVMGDNRESSVDSRYWTSTNYVHKDLIIGKAKFCYFPFNDAGKLE